MLNQDKLTWLAEYKDGIIISQFDKYGNKISTDDLPRENLRIFKILTNKGKVLFVQELKIGYQFIYRKRTVLRTGKNTVETIHIVGWQKQTADEEVRHISFVYESDFSIELGDFRKESQNNYGYLSQWKYPIKFSDKDKLIIS